MKKIFLIFCAFFLMNFSYQKSDFVDFKIEKIYGADIEKKPFMMIFFDLNCQICVKKVLGINNDIKNFSDVNILLILLDETQLQNILDFKLNEKIILVKSPKNIRNFTKKLGNKNGELPFISLLSKDYKFCKSARDLFLKEEIANCQ